ncbi:unnamed protein product, partial [Coregonus sp. 'balchen']
IKENNAWHKAVILFITVLVITAIVALVTTAVLQNQPLLQKYKRRRMTQEECSRHMPAKCWYLQLLCVSRAGRGVSEELMENQSLSDLVLGSVEEALRSSPFSYQGARIITGQEEGAFGWVTVNYLSDRLKQGSGTTGALDLGGASTQISFVANQDGAEESAENAVTFRLYGNDYFLYTHSFLCYGKDQVLKLALSQQTQSGDSSVLDPCFHPGYSVDRDYSSVYSSPCVMTGKPLVSRDSFTHIGTGNASQCQEVVRRIFNFSGCSFSRCSFNGIKQQHPDVKEKYLAEYCFSGSYILSLLTDGYNFTSDTWTHITFIKKISGSDAGWTLGYMLNLTNMIPAEAPDTPPLPHAGYITLQFFISLLLFFFLLFLLFLSLRSRWPRCNSQTQMI